MKMTNFHPSFCPHRAWLLVRNYFSVFAFDDGSCVFLSWKAETTADKDGLPTSDGQGIIVKGIGRFEGIKGTSVFSGKEHRFSGPPKQVPVPSLRSAAPELQRYFIVISQLP
ncbi:MAG: hypothetical protein HY881_22655 [Deltaproteobacteria bacterium]|nr:hypothetical protein [Deltaproteobacteria bacterium]